MNMHLIDWGIVIAVIAFMVGGVVLSRTYMRSVADFLSAGRTAGRYLVCVAEGIAALGAISVIADFEMNYEAGFALTWWNFTMAVFVLIVTVSGWVIYRFRETRALTMAQFFEMRYSRKFRIFAGFVAFVSGLINFGIFPAVGSRFFIYFAGLPETFSLLGLTVSTFAFVMIVLLSISIFFVFVGGQVAVIITDFVQGIFVSIVFVIIVVFFFKVFSFSQIFEALQTAPVDASKINPYQTSQAEDFNVWFFIIGVAIVFYNKLSWQGTQGYNSSAKSAHEAKMGQVLTNWRSIPQFLFLLFIPICIYTVMYHRDFLMQASAVQNVLDGMDTKELQNQLRIPIVLTHFLPKGLMGAFAAVMLAAFISTHDTYLHSWGSIFVQDILLPLRKKPFSHKQHIKILRWAIIGVAVFIFFFSFLFRQTQYIRMYFPITAALFVGGSGAVIICGLYWKKGTTAGAWSAMIVGAGISITGIIILQINKDFFINGIWFTLLSMVGALSSYYIVSILSRKQDFNLDKLLHRGKYTIEGEHQIFEAEPVKGWKVLGIGKEFSKGDKLIYIATYAYIFSWVVLFIVGTIYYFTVGLDDAGWMKFWYIYLWIQVVVSIIITIWFAIGGFSDIKKMLKDLATMKRDHRDAGFVVGHQSLSEVVDKE